VWIRWAQMYVVMYIGGQGGIGSVAILIARHPSG
jgi:hypothetical protein